MNRFAIPIGLLLLADGAAAVAVQDIPVGQAISNPDPVAGQPRDPSNAAVAGRRTFSEDAPTPPMPTAGRIDDRIANRVQARIRNRIDRYYAPQANAASPFVIAGEQVHIAGRRSGR